ncbi:uncharacterized protein [Hetaerina americana]|uniref:uncharacterized protein isoform X2 n=1 Tax=Hetaerina americana TaxID=62018 RepID=UPI003A7F3C38
MSWHSPTMLVRPPPVAQAGVGLGGPQYNHRQQCIISGSSGIGMMPHSMEDLGLVMEDGLGYLESTEPQVLFENHQGLHQGAMNSAIWVSNGSSPGVAENLVPNDTRQQYAHSCMKPGSVPNPLVIGNSSQATYATNNYSYGPTPVGYNHEPMPYGPSCPPVAKDGLVHLTNISDYSKRVVMPNSAEPNNWSMVGTMVRLGREQQAPLRTDAAWVGGDPFVPVVPNTSPVNRVSVVPSDQVHSAFGYHFMDNLHSAPNMVQTSQVLETGNNRIPGFGGNAAGSVLTKCYASNANISHFRVQPVNGAAKSTAQPGEGDGLNHHVVSGRLNHQGQPSGSATGSAKLQLALMGGNSLRVMDKPSLKRYLDERLRRAEDVQRVLTEAQKDLKQAPTTAGAVGKKGPHVPRILGGKAKQWRRKKAPKGAELAVDPSVTEGAHGPVPLIEGEAEEIVVEVDLPEGMFSEEDEDTEGHFAVAEEDGGVSVDRDDSNGPHAEPQTSVKDRTADNRGKDRRKRHSTSWHRTWDPKMSILVLKRVKDGVRVSGKGGGRPAKDSHPSKDLPRRTSLLNNGKLRNVSLKDCYVRLVRCDAPGGVLYHGQGDKTEPSTTAEVVPSHDNAANTCHQTASSNEGNEPEQLPPAIPTQEQPPVLPPVLPPPVAEVDRKRCTEVDGEPCTKVNREQDYWLQMLDRERREALEALEAVRKRLEEEKAANELALDNMRNSLLSQATDSLDERQWMLLEEEFRKRENKRKRASLSEDEGGGILSSSGEDTNQSEELGLKSDGLACRAVALRCADPSVVSSGEVSGPAGPCVPLETSGSRWNSNTTASEFEEIWSGIRDDRIMELQRMASKERRCAARHSTKVCSVRLEKCHQTDVRINSLLEMHSLKLTTGPVVHGDSGCVSRTSIVCLQGRVGISRTGFAAKETEIGAQGANSSSTIVMLEMNKLVVVVKNIKLAPDSTTGVMKDQPSLSTEGRRRSLRNRQPLLAIADHKVESGVERGTSTVGRRTPKQSGVKAIAAQDVELKPCHVRLVRCDQTTECSPLKKRKK